MSHGYMERRLNEGLITAISVAGVLIILGLVVLLTPGIYQDANSFSKDFTNVSYTIGGSTITLPAPANPSEHIALFTAVMDFLLAVGILQILILAVRLVLRSPIRRTAQTVGSLIFWLGAAVVANVFLLAGTLDGWFRFWAGLIVLIGISLVARFTIHLMYRSSRNKRSEP